MTETTARSFNPTATRAERALQAWQILVSCAANRQTITYEGLGDAMFGRRAAGVLSQTLDLIARYCGDRGLPPLTAVVVGTNRGTPGTGLPTGVATVDRDRELVYGCKWFTFVPPTLEQLV